MVTASTGPVRSLLLRILFPLGAFGDRRGGRPMRATTKPNPPRRPVLLRRLAAALALAALLLLGAMTSAAWSPRSPRTTRATATGAAAATEPLHQPRRPREAPRGSKPPAGG